MILKLPLYYLEFYSSWQCYRKKEIDILNFLPNRIDSDSIGSHPSQSKHPFKYPNLLYSLAEHPFHPSFGGRNTSRKRGAIN
jgi:hypothetical protein